MEENHDRIYGGHVGVTKTLESVRKTFDCAEYKRNIKIGAAYVLPIPRYKPIRKNKRMGLITMPVLVRDWLPRFGVHMETNFNERPELFQICQPNRCIPSPMVWCIKRTEPLTDIRPKLMDDQRDSTGYLHLFLFSFCSASHNITSDYVVT